MSSFIKYKQGKQNPQKISKYLKMKKLGKGSKNNHCNLVESKKVFVPFQFQKLQLMSIQGKNCCEKIQAYAEKSWLEQEKIPKRKFQDLKNF